MEVQSRKSHSGPSGGLNVRPTRGVTDLDPNAQIPLRTYLADDQHTLYFYRGRVALSAVLRALELRAGDEVLLQAFTCLAVPLPIVGLSLRPVYLDIDRSTFNINPAEIEARITRRTKAIIVQHTFGIPAEMESIMAVARKHGLAVIEDCSHVLGSKYGGRELGSFGDAAFFSYEWGKPVVIGLGGTAVINSPELLERLRLIYKTFDPPPAMNVLLLNLEYLAYSIVRRLGLFWIMRDLYRTLWTNGLVIGNFQREELAGHLTADYQRAMPTLFRARLRAKLLRAETNVAHRKWVRAQYEKGLRELHITSLSQMCGDTVLLRYPILTTDKTEVLSMARKRNIELGAWFASPVDPLREKEWHTVGYQQSSCPVAEEVSSRIVTLPIYDGIGEQTIQRTLQFVREMRDCDWIE
jgi:perosamine synthetase